VISNHSIAAMSLEFCLLTTESQVLPERFVYMPQRVMFPVLLRPCESFISVGYMLALVEADEDFLQIKWENKDTKISTQGWGDSGCWNCSNDI